MQSILPEKDPFELRWWTSRGRGAGTTARVVAEAALEEGYHSQAFHDFPLPAPDETLAFTARVSRKPLFTHYKQSRSQVLFLEDSVTPPSGGGILSLVEPNGLIFFNTPKSIREIQKLLSFTGRIFVFNASEIAQYFLGEDHPYLALLGAFLKIHPLFSLKTMEQILREKYEKSWGGNLVDKNIITLRMGYNEMETKK
jgi:pyruvate ferredoxin oxidoreductase gamma subunit